MDDISLQSTDLRLALRNLKSRFSYYKTRIPPVLIGSPDLVHHRVANCVAIDTVRMVSHADWASSSSSSAWIPSLMFQDVSHKGNYSVIRPWHMVPMLSLSISNASREPSLPNCILYERLVQENIERREGAVRANSSCLAKKTAQQPGCPPCVIFLSLQSCRKRGLRQTMPLDHPHAPAAETTISVSTSLEGG